MTPQEAIAIQVFRRPLTKRLFYALFRWGWLAILLLAFWLSGCSVDNRAEWPESDELQAIQQEEAAKERMDRADRAVCGPGAIAQRDGDELSCIPKRGRAYTVAGAQP